MPELEGMLTLGLLSARVAPSGLVLAALFRGFVPWWVLLGSSLAVAAGLSVGMPSVAAVLQTDFALMLLRELCVGATFALAAVVPFVALQWTTRIAERPGFAGSAPLSTLYVLSAVAMVLALGAPRALVAALARSLRSVPLGSASLSRQGYLGHVSDIVQGAFDLTLSIGLPLWMALWLLDVALGIVGRLTGDAREVSRSPLRAALTLLLLALMLWPLISHTPALLRSALDRASALVLRFVP